MCVLTVVSRSVPFRQPADCRPSPSLKASAATGGGDLLASMAHRLASAEGELQSYKRELAEKVMFVRVLY